DLKKTESTALALAAAAPSSAPRRSARALDRDFADQAQAVAEAERTFAPSARPVGPADPFGGGSGAFAPPPPQSREGKAQVRANQEKASNFGF
ncbi:MAG TPA: hypothetical protein VM925_14485, partial [Labilithrix sp.]|nr:hypothetical protein [Labilithrix sp.]